MLQKFICDKSQLHTALNDMLQVGEELKSGKYWINVGRSYCGVAPSAEFGVPIIVRLQRKNGLFHTFDGVPKNSNCSANPGGCPVFAFKNK